MILFFTIPKAVKPYFNEEAKKLGLSKRKFAKQLIYHYWSHKVDQKKRTDYYNEINRQ